MSEQPTTGSTTAAADAGTTPGTAGNGGDAADPGAPPSGLRNPVAAVRGVGAGALVIEAVALLLAIAPMRMLHVRDTGAAMITVAVLALVCLMLAGKLRRPWVWWAGLAPQVVLLACGYFSLALTVLGVLFGLVWIYVLSVRRSVLGGAR